MRQPPFVRLTQLVAGNKLQGRRVFIRDDLNVPQDENGNVTDDTRIRASLPGIRMALDAGAAVMVTSHLGRPAEGAFTPADSLAPIAIRLSELLQRKVPLISNWAENGVQVAPGEVVLLENCRLNPGEKKNNPELAQKLARYCDVYVNDAFGIAHRAEVTTYGMAEYAPIACAGPLLATEVDAISRALAQPRRPMVAIVGGSKVSTKLGVLKNLATQVDLLIVGGGIANNFILASGNPIGKSLCEPELLKETREIMAIMKERGAEVPVPTDVVVAKNLSANAPTQLKKVEDIADDDMIVDIGPHSASVLADFIGRAATIIWNGPVGIFEFPSGAHGTEILARAIARSPAFSIAGGGDTLAAIAKFGIENDISYISTGGGAFLEMAEGKKLPAIEILERRGTVL